MKSPTVQRPLKMPLEIEGCTFFTNAEVAQLLGITRQTLWRWRVEGEVPMGRQFRRKTIVFTQDEVDQIAAFANRIEPIPPDARSQRKLFCANDQGRTDA